MKTRVRLTVKLSEKGLAFIDVLRGLRVLNSFVISVLRYIQTNSKELDVVKYLTYSSEFKPRQCVVVLDPVKHKDVINFVQQSDRASMQLLVSCFIEQLARNPNLIKEVFLNQKVVQSGSLSISKTREVTEPPQTADTKPEDFDLGFLIHK